MRLTCFILFISVTANFVGCSNKIEVVPSNMPQLFVPTAFTPNGDHVNDTFLIKVSKPLTYYHIAIHDNNNITVYQGNNILNGWNGTYQDGPEPVGSYLWVINYQAEGTKVVQLSGSMELIR